MPPPETCHGLSAPGGSSPGNSDQQACTICINDITEGLQEGISLFSPPSRIALIYARHAEDPVRIHDPQHLLRGHEPKLAQFYLDSTAWRKAAPSPELLKGSTTMHPEPGLDLSGLISFGGRSRSIFYQMWFTEHHPDMCSVGPTECWLEHAAWRLAHDVANPKEYYTGISGYFLKEYAAHAVRDYIVDEMNLKIGMDTDLRVYPILDAVLGVSRTREEGKWPRGRLMFVEPRYLEFKSFIARFPRSERPSLDNHKHVRKTLLAVEDSPRQLISDGRWIWGISNDDWPDFALIADFRGGHGFMHINGKRICSFADGKFQSTTRRAKLVQVEEALLEYNLDPGQGSVLFKIISHIVHHAQDAKFGCTLVVDLNDPPVTIAGQKLERALDLREHHLLDLAQALAKTDGALHIGADLHLHGFACLLDGSTIPGEDRARGARFNSALRFSAAHPNLLVVVVSADRPVSIIQEGLEISAQCRFQAVVRTTRVPPVLRQWVDNTM